MGKYVGMSSYFNMETILLSPRFFILAILKWRKLQRHRQIKLKKIMSEMNFFNSDVFGVIDPRKKFDRESSSEVSRMTGCSNQLYENFDFICQRLYSIFT